MRILRAGHMITGDAALRQLGADVDRAVNSGTLDIGLKPGMGAGEDAKFAQAVKFEEGKMAAQCGGGVMRMAR